MSTRPIERSLDDSSSDYQPSITPEDAKKIREIAETFNITLSSPPPQRIQRSHTVSTITPLPSLRGSREINGLSQVSSTTTTVQKVSFIKEQNSSIPSFDDDTALQRHGSAPNMKLKKEPTGFPRCSSEDDNISTFKRPFQKKENKIVHELEELFSSHSLFNKKNWEVGITQKIESLIEESLKKNILLKPSEAARLFMDQNLECVNFSSRLEKASQLLPFNLSEMKTFHSLRTFYKTQKREEKEIIIALLGGKEVVKHLEELSEKTVTPYAKNALNKVIKVHIDQHLPSILIQIKTVCIDDEEKMTLIIIQTLKRLTQSNSNILLSREKLEEELLRVLLRRLSEAYDYLEKHWLASLLSPLKEHQTIKDFIKKTESLPKPIFEGVIAILGGVKAWEVLLKYNFSKELNGNTFERISSYDALSRLENLKIHFIKDFDWEAKYPIILSDPTQVLLTFRFFSDNKSAGNSDYFTINNEKLTIIDLNHWATENKINKQTKNPELLFSSWLFHNIEKKFFESELTPAQIFETLSQLENPIPSEDVIYLKKFLETCLSDPVCESLPHALRNPSDIINAKKRFVLSKISEIKKTIDKQFLELLMSELKIQDSIFFADFDPTKKLSNDAQAASVINLLLRKYAHTKFSHSLHSFSIFCAFSTGAFSFAEMALRKKFPNLYHTQAHKLKIKHSPFNPTTYSLNIDRSSGTFSLTQKKFFFLSHTLPKQDAFCSNSNEKKYGGFPVSFAISGNLNDDPHYSAQVVIGEISFYPGTTITESLEVAKTFAELTKS